VTGCLFKLASLESQVPGGLTATIREAAFQLLVRSPLEFAFDRAPRALLPAGGMNFDAGSQADSA
jgi:hypothetical protein